jgi:hypothetical protein
VIGTIAETMTVNAPVSTVNTETVTISESISPTILNYNPWQLANRAIQLDSDDSVGRETDVLTGKRHTFAGDSGR